VWTPDGFAPEFIFASKEEAKNAWFFYRNGAKSGPVDKLEMFGHNIASPEVLVAMWEHR